MSDEPGVMGNLPRSRPGRRSAKRGGAGAGPKRAAEVKPAKPKTTRAKAASGSAKAAGSAKSARGTGAKARGSAKAAGGAKSGASARSTPRTPSKPTRARVGGPAATTPSAGLEPDTAPDTAVRDERVETAQSSDPITSALRLGMAVGDAGLKAVAKIVERLPRP